jgi:hypothetical protein
MSSVIFILMLQSILHFVGFYADTPQYIVFAHLNGSHLLPISEWMFTGLDGGFRTTKYRLFQRLLSSGDSA